MTPDHFCTLAYIVGIGAVLLIASGVLSWIASIWIGDYMAGRK